MAVYTEVTDEALHAFLGEYTLGLPTAFKGIAEGVENSNYYLETTAGRYILTLFEKRVNEDDLPYFVALKRHLAAAGFPCPEPIEGKDGKTLRRLQGRPALIVSFLEGLSPKRPNPVQCRELGAGLARMHLAFDGFDKVRTNSLGPAGWPPLWQGRSAVAETLQEGLSELIEADLAAMQALPDIMQTLPTGTIHADLFPDNAFFLGDTFTGAIDFLFRLH